MNPVENAWVVRVAGKEYGPVDLSTLHEWKAEGRLIPVNEVRPANGDRWQPAAEIPGLFDQSTAGVAEKPASRETPRINLIRETFGIYRRGFIKFLGLTLLVVGPAVCGQVIAVMLSRNTGIGGDVRLLIGSMVSFFVMMLTLLLTPIYIAGIQLLTAELHFKRNISFRSLLTDAVKFWPRVAVLWAFVFLCYAFWTILPVGVILALAQGGPSFISIFLILLLLAMQVWMTGRLFINFLFWQQFAVLDCCGTAESLRRSKELARSRGNLPWFCRPMWRGIFIASLWFALVLALNWPAISAFYQTSLGAMTSSTDPQVIVEQLSKTAQATGDGTAFLTGLIQAIFKPLLGIAFVLLYLDCKF